MNITFTEAINIGAGFTVGAAGVYFMLYFATTMLDRVFSGRKNDKS